MLELSLAIFGAGGLVVLAEIAWRNKLLKGELARKSVHIAVGTYVAFWPYFLPKQSIQLIAVAATLTLVVIKRLDLIKVMHDINRWSIGDVLFPVSVLLVLSYANANWIYTVAILFLSLADGMAAVIGRKYASKAHTFNLLGSKKTLQGSLGYLVFAYLSLAIGYMLGGKETMMSIPMLAFVGVPVLSTLLEAISPFGLDNIVVPLFILLAFNSLVS